MKIGFVAGWPPEDKQGEANYAFKIVKKYKECYLHDDIIVYAHVNKSSDKDKVRFSVKNEGDIIIKRVTNGSNFLSRTLRSIVLPFRIINDRCKIVHYQGVHTPLYGALFGESMLFNFFILKIFGVKQFYSLHSTWMKSDIDKLVLDKNKGKLMSYLFRVYYNFYLRAVYYLMDKVLVVSCGNHDIAVESFLDEWSLSPKKTFKENHPCHVSEEVNTDKEYTYNTEQKVILCLGYIRRDKGIHSLIEAFEKISKTYENLRLVIGGESIGKDGEKYVDFLKSQIEKSPFKDSIEFLNGYIPQKKFQDLFNESSVVVVPYSRVIGPSGPIHYALGRGKVVVASDLGHNSNLLDLVCLYGSNQSLSDSLLKVLEDHHYTQKLKKNIFKYIEKNSWKNMVTQYNNFYKMEKINEN